MGGEPVSLWKHSVCYTCWEKDNPLRQAVAVFPADVRTCCSCGKEHASGIFLRRDPEQMRCKGRGEEHVA